MKSKILTAIILAALCTASVTSCGTVENIADQSALNLESSIADDSLEEITEEITTLTETTTEATTADNTEEGTGEWQTVPDGGYVAQPDGDIATQTPATEAPTAAPTVAPTEAPTNAPTETPTEAPTEAPAGSFAHDDMFFIYGSAQATVLVDASGLVSSLGAPSSVEEADGCLSNGNSVKNYYYSGLTVYTYIDGDREVIYEIELSDSSVSTSKGLKTGMTLADAESLYGKNYTQSGNTYCYYDSGNTYMYIITSGDTIVSIGYAAEV